ncbi:putative type IX secretion system sortase PorU2 [Spirosoma flavum]|uniref:C25 family cysteine peptidase n=1 Tax=Spirosoma flavum TaxID=2048557 RepID=A0ABW6AFC9_9BACT
MKKGLLFVWIVVNALVVNAQNRFGNEWIQSGQKYLKFSVNQAGIYRVGYDDIKTADASFLQTNPATWQLFFRGHEVAVRVVGQQDGVFDKQDYIEFYGEGNDGSQDSLLYRPQQRLHPYQTLFSDKAAFFLTSSLTLVGKRMPELNTSAQGLSPEKFHIEETVHAFTSDYTFNNLKGLEPALQQSYFEPGEGWSGPLLTADSVGVVQMKLPGRASVNWPIMLEGMVNGRDNSFHQIQVQVDATTILPIAPLSCAGFASQTFQSIVNPLTIQNEQLTIKFKSEKNGYTNNFSITYVKVLYPQLLDMTGQPNKVFHLPPNPRLTALMAIKNVPAATVAYDITDKANCRYLATQIIDGQTLIVVTETTRSRDILLTNHINKPLATQSVKLQIVLPKTTDYLIITHSSLRPSAVTYANYRASVEGGSYKPFIVESDSLYDQFNYGEKSPLGLRRFADFALANSSVKNLLLIGRANSYPYTVKTSVNDLVPTVGYPGSDILLTAGLGSYPINTPAIPTGRINTETNEQVLTYLEKVKQLEGATPNGLWRKHIVHISGGKTGPEASGLREALSGIGAIYTNGLLGGQISSFSKSTTDEVEQINISPLVNDGVSLITFFGHAGPSVTDMNFGFASPPENGFRNQYYPLMIFNGCGVGEIFSNFKTLSTDWLLAPQKGAALVLAHTYWSFQQPTTRYLTKLYTDLYADATTLGQPFGKVQQQLNMALEGEGVNPYDVSVMLQMLLQGDPAVSFYPLPNPDFSVEQKGLYIQSKVIGSSLKNSDSLRVIIPLANLGKFVAGQLVVLSLKKTINGVITSSTFPFAAFRYRDTLAYTMAKDERLQRIEVIIDPDNQVIELSKANNKATLDIDWTQAQSSSSYPANVLPDRVSPEINVFIDGKIRENQAVVGLNPQLEIYILDENPLSSKDTNAVDIYLKSCETCSPQKISAALFSVSAVSANQLQVTTNLSLTEGSNYQLVVFGKDAAGNRTQPPYILDIGVVANDEPVTLRAYPNPAATYVKFELTLNVKELPTESHLTVYNQSGIQVFEDSFSVSTGKNSFLWQGTTPGLYPYSLRLTYKDGRAEMHTGKVVWQH